MIREFQLFFPSTTMNILWAARFEVSFLRALRI